METTISGTTKEGASSIATAHSGNFISNWFNRQTAAFEESRFGLMTIYITIQSCLGSFACMYVLENNGPDLPLILTAAVTMWANAMFIAQASAKWCMIIFYLSILTNATIIGLFSF